MHTTNLRKVGGSVMLAVPPAILELLRLRAGSTVGIAVDGERLVIESKVKPHYTLAQLLAESDDSTSRKVKDREWLDAPPVGRELL